MSESKQAGPVVFRVVDKRGGLHSITADRMMVSDGVVTFFEGRHSEVGSFSDPIGAMLAENATSATFADLTPGEACVSVFESADRGLVPVSWALVAVVAALVGLKAYELFGFAG